MDCVFDDPALLGRKTTHLLGEEIVMNAHQERVLQSFRRVQGWLAANPQYTASTPALATQLEALNGTVQRLTDHAATQETQRTNALLDSKDEVEKRQEVVSHQMKPIAKVARALRGVVPGIGVLKLPKGNIPTPSVINAATSMVQKAEIYKDVLIESGLPANCLEELKNATAALQASLDARGLARAARVAATRGVEGELTLGRRTVAIMDANLARLLRTQPAKLAEWEQLKRVTVKGIAVRGSIGLVESSSPAEQPSSTAVQGDSTAGVKAA
jgi:hypothetical protein